MSLGFGFRRSDARSLTSYVDAVPAVPLMIVFVLIAAGLRVFTPSNTDVSWIIVMCEKVLDGQRLYTDIIETNPPATVWLYLPFVAFARAVHLSAEFVIDASIFVFAFLVMSVCERFLERTEFGQRISSFGLRIGAVFILLILPHYTFGEREHIALIAALPMLCLLMLRLEGETPSVGQMVFAGLCAGLTMVIKPHFALGLAPGVIVASFHAYRQGQSFWRSMFALENWIAAVLVVAYVVAAYVRYPLFFEEVMPLVTLAYLPNRAPLDSMLFPVVPMMLIIFALTHARGSDLRRPPYSLLASMALGFLAVYFVQGKGWPYHSYPALALAGFSLVAAWCEPTQPNGSRLLQIVVAVLMGAASLGWFSLGNKVPEIAAAIKRIKANPSIAIISDDLAFGHPVTRQVKGTWVQAYCSSWVLFGVRNQLLYSTLTDERRQQLTSVEEQHRALMVGEIATKKPDILLIQSAPTDWTEWAKEDASLMREIDNYTLVQRFEKANLYARKAEQ